ncbi:hypothetical protein PQ689_03100 [Thermoanaerobacterium thermosaccharolyticum]|uniref:hypothetical protein n=1 Tax=Thermoanaerobacterium thermosaccharolyticum TaxID=1517 RepID=UPI003DA9F609
MAYENGYEAVNYIGTCIERYEKDTLIFSKAAQLIPIFISRPDWPHSYGELDKAVEIILGISLSNLIYGFTMRYIYDKSIKWPNNLPESFKEELEAFHLAVSPIVDQYYIGRANPMKLFSIASSYNGEKQIIRFIRMDGSFLDFEMSNYDIGKVLNTLESYYKRQVGPTI